MPLTEEQIKNLKPGDPLVAQGTYIKQYSNGDIVIKCNITVGGKLTSDIKYFHPTCVSLPEKPKHDPCRLFRNGDIVRCVERDGRSYVDAPPVGATCCVCVGEDSVGMVSVEFKFSENEEPAVHDVPFYHLELVTPVEELEPYELVETTDYWSVEKENEELCLFWKKHHHNAKKAAEDERDRLNEEWRKEQNNG